MKNLYILFIVFFITSCNKNDNVISNNVIAFYYNWYGNIEYDSVLDHWAHGIASAPVYNEADKGGFIDGMNNDIAANFYPKLGCYSNNDPNLLEEHMKMLLRAGVGVISLTWWGIDDLKKRNIPLLFDVAEKYGIKICFHFEPFGDRCPETVRENVEFIFDKFGTHPAFYKVNGKPMYFIYDSYLISPSEWSRLLKQDGEITLRNTVYDGLFIGLNLRKEELDDIVDGGFDGFYTYFSSVGFTEATDINNWNYMQDWAEKNNKLFIPSVGPGYIDTKIRPWNYTTTRGRENGKYYDKMWSKAIECKVKYVSITSFNEWHEGSQIEPAIPMECMDFKYLDYGDLGENYYLDRTAFWVKRMLKCNY